MRISDWSSDVCSSDLQHAPLLLLVEVLDDVDGVVAVEVRQRQGDVLRLQRLEHFLAHGDVEVGQHRQVELRAQGLYELRALLAVEVLQQVGEVEIGRASCRDRVCKYGWI